MRKILVVQTASIGDVILATPVLEKLHLFFPSAAIDILLKKGTEQLFVGHPYLHEVLVWDKKNDKFRNFEKLMHRVRHSKYDLVVNLQRFFMTGLLTAFSGAGVKTGFDKNPLSFLFTSRTKHQIGTGMHEAERNLSLISSMTDSIFTPPRLYPSKQDEVKTAIFKSGVYYTISPASLWFTKQYPEEKWVELINTIPSETPVYLLGSKSDNELCQSIIQKSVNKVCVDLSGQLTFLESASLMKDARMNFTNDSAPMHLASAVNAPVTAIYCSTIPGFGFGPLSDDRKVIETPENLSCRPCGLHGHPECPEKHFRCAMTIPAVSLQERL
jgi:heptosyltransferase-2